MSYTATITANCVVTTEIAAVGAAGDERRTGTELSSHASQYEVSGTPFEYSTHALVVAGYNKDDDTIDQPNTPSDRWSRHHLSEDMTTSMSTVTSATTPTHYSGSPSDDSMRVKMALALEEHLNDHPDSIRARYERTLEIEGTSPKPCIVPGNALQLIDDSDPDSSIHAPPSIIIISNGHDASTDDLSPPSDSPETSSAEPTTAITERRSQRPGPKVRFRSRVRITSGLRKHRHCSTTAATTTSPTTLNGASGNAPSIGGSLHPGGGGGEHVSPSLCSSCSGSPSSSISAPLRWQADDDHEQGTTTWGPMGRRLSAYNACGSNGWATKPRQNRQNNSNVRSNSVSPRSKLLRPDERTPLIAGGSGGGGGRRTRSRIAYVDNGLDGGGAASNERPRMFRRGEYDDDYLDEAEERALRALALRREQDAVFGKWPWRVFNRHWWWWHLEPVLCCCADDSEDDEF